MPGPNPTFAETWAQLGKAILYINAIELRGWSTTPNLLDAKDALITSLDGVHTPKALPVLERLVQAPIAGVLSKQTLQQVFRPFLWELGRVISAPEMAAGRAPSDGMLIRRIRDYMVAQGPDETILSRGMTIDSSGTTTGTGDGVINRLTVDRYNYALECTGGEAKTFVCDKDQTTQGTRQHEEEFRLDFAPAWEDSLYWTGSGPRNARLKCLHAASSGILRNPSFDLPGGVSDDTAPTSTTAISGWTIASAAANFKLRSAAGYTYRGYPGAPSTQYGLQFVGNDTIAQILRTEQPGRGFDQRVPVYAQVAYQRKGSATGNLNLHVGSQSSTAVIGSATNDAWAILRLALGTKCWYDNFREDALDIKLVVDSLATGTVVVDDVIVAPMSMLDGTWWAAVGGAASFLLGDQVAFTDADGGTRALHSYWLWRAWEHELAVLAEAMGWFPSAGSGSNTIAQPS
jgi:hypothetical protein